MHKTVIKLNYMKWTYRAKRAGSWSSLQSPHWDTGNSQKTQHDEQDVFHTALICFVTLSRCLSLSACLSHTRTHFHTGTLTKSSLFRRYCTGWEDIQASGLLQLTPPKCNLRAYTSTSSLAACKRVKEHQKIKKQQTWQLQRKMFYCVRACYLGWSSLLAVFSRLLSVLRSRYCPV